ncbi:MAG: ABC transporter ATP-binding protein [Acidimicrobiales bacterium]
MSTSPGRPGPDLAHGPLIALAGATKSYRDAEGSVQALRGVDLAVEAGEFVAVMGPSGSGKSTMLHLIGGLDRATSGRVRVDGVELSRLSASALAGFRSRRVGFVFQAFNLLPNLTAAENVSLPAVLAGSPRSVIRQRVADLLEAFDLTDKSSRLPGQLSGGEQQRVAVARALVMNPAVILADEPTGSLDSSAAEGLLGMFSRCHSDGQTIVLVTHDPGVAGRAERVLHMRDGKFVEQSHLYRPTRPVLSELIRTGEASAGPAVTEANTPD